jgi:hypothetical protein
MFGVGSILPLAAHCAVQQALWGTILPVQMIGGAGDYPHSYWNAPVGPDTWAVASWKYWVLTLFSTRGLFVLSPILLVGAAELIEDVKAALKAGWRRAAGASAGRGYAALTVLFAMVLLIGYYGFLGPRSFGGSCYGFRWYIGFMPLLGWYAAAAFVRRGGEERFRRLFFLFGLISLMFALIGLREPWTLMENNPHPVIQALSILRGF